MPIKEFAAALAAVLERDRQVTMLRAYIEARPEGHYHCDDSWYSCPKAEEGCANADVGTECTCGGDERIAARAAILAATGTASTAGLALCFICQLRPGEPDVCADCSSSPAPVSVSAAQMLEGVRDALSEPFVIVPWSEVPMTFLSATTSAGPDCPRDAPCAAVGFHASDECEPWPVCPRCHRTAPAEVHTCTPVAP